MIMQDNEKKPALRFKGFTDPWEQRKVREVTDRYDNLRIPVAASLRVAGTTPYYGANGIQDYVEGYTHDGEFILVAEDGANDLKNYPVKCVKGRIWVNNHAHVLQGKCACADNQFLAYAISQADIESLLVGGGRAKLNAETLMDIELLLPSKNEQIQIGHYLARLDHLITLHQRKYERLVNIKKSMLDKMFPKNGASVPEIRFKGFTDPWEQRKLGDITVELSEYATQELGLPLLTSSRSGLMYQDEYRDSRTTKSTETLFSVVPVGTCTYRHMSDDDVFHMNINTLEKGLVSREYPVFEASKGNNLEFLVQHINSSEEFKAFCAEQKKGGTRTRLYYNTLCQFTVRVPALKEQAQISQCLKKLDTLITLHQRKLEKLQNIKKSCLEKMFV